MQTDAVAGAQPLKRAFFWLLLVATLLPMMLVPLATSVRPDSQSMLLVIAVIGFLGGSGHVGLTGFYYAEPEFRRFFRTRPWRYFIFPSIVVVGTAALYQFGSPIARAYVLLGYFAWQTYHYQRQNHGILSFVAGATSSGAPLWQERAAFDLGCFAGILGLLAIYNLGNGTVFERYAALLYDVGMFAAVVVVPVLVIWAVAIHARSGRWSGVRVAAAVLGSLFFLPSFLFSHPLQAVSSYAWAHGLQYYVFMYFVGRTGGASSRRTRLLMLAAACVVVGGGLYALSDRGRWGTYADGIFGAYLGLVMVHFLVDAGVWRLREPFQGGYLRRSFAFLFTPR